MDDLGYIYGGLVVNGVNVVYDWVIGVDCDIKIVMLVGGFVLKYDKLILSFGIDFVDMLVFGWDIIL